MTHPLRIIPLGGLGEVGMNCMAIEFGKERVIIDCGVTFPGRVHGIDLDHPRFDHLTETPERLVAILITHGHEDHIGAIPYLLRELDDAGRPPESIPIYGPPYALKLIERRLGEFDLGDLDLRPTQPRQRFAVGSFEVEPYRVNHSIPDSTGLILRTPAGTLVHSGDFKIEENPVDGRNFDSDRLREVGDEGVDLLLSDSTNVDSEGMAGEEGDVLDAIAPLVLEAPNRVVVALFASNVYRMRAAFEAAKQSHRRVLLLGRSVENHGRVARELGFLEGIDRMIVSPEQAQKLPRDRLLVIATGTQGERPAALTRLSRDDHRYLSLDPGDRVILSSRIIPGCERAVFEMCDALERQGMEVIGRRQAPGVHVSGHACRDEQRRLMELLRPKAFLPVHGTYHHLVRHAELAEEVGIDETLVIENGGVAEYRDGKLAEVASVTIGRKHIDRQQEVEERQLKARRLMGELGVAFVAFPVDEDLRLCGRVEITQRGFLRTDAEEILDDAAAYVASDYRRQRKVTDLDDAEDRVRRALKRFFARNLGRKPLVVPLAVEA